MRRRARERQEKREDKRPIFEETVCCPSAVVQGAARQKMVCVGGVPGVTGILGKANSHFDLTQTELGTAPGRGGGC